MILSKFRKIQMLTSSSIFIFIFLFFLNFIKKNFFEIQLSYWGIENPLSWVWNGTLIFLSFSMFINIYHFIIENNFNKKNILIFLFFTTMFSLFMIGLINMKYHIHTIIALYYFFSYPLWIILLVITNIKKMSFRYYLMHLLFSVIIFSIPIYFLNFFKGLSMAETSHSFLILLWNILILRKK